MLLGNLLNCSMQTPEENYGNKVLFPGDPSNTLEHENVASIWVLCVMHEFTQNIDGTGLCNNCKLIFGVNNDIRNGQKLYHIEKNA